MPEYFFLIYVMYSYGFAQILREFVCIKFAKNGLR